MALFLHTTPCSPHAALHGSLFRITQMLDEVHLDSVSSESTLLRSPLGPIRSHISSTSSPDMHKLGGHAHKVGAGLRSILNFSDGDWQAGQQEPQVRKPRASAAGNTGLRSQSPPPAPINVPIVLAKDRVSLSPRERLATAVKHSDEHALRYVYPLCAASGCHGI